MKGLTTVHTSNGMGKSRSGGSFYTWSRHCLPMLWALLWSLNPAAAQNGITSGLYEIVSGTYTTCCGIAGPLTVALPNNSQQFVSLTVDPQTGLASMSFLGSDHQTIFSIVSCLPGGPIPFTLSYGFCQSNSITFLVDPGPPPNSIYWHYYVNSSTNSLLINGTLGMAQQNCPDVPTQFAHSNVVATLVTCPIVRVTEYSKQGAFLTVQGHGGWTNVIEASADLRSWTAICTNLMPTGGCSMCSSIVYRDIASTNLASRFYRCFER
jgi:hypothetical protein